VQVEHPVATLPNIVHESALDVNDARCEGAGTMGLLLCVLSAACFAALGVFGKLAYDADVGILTLLTVRFAMAAAGFGVLTLVVPGARVRMDRRLVLIAFALGSVGYAAQAGLFFAALEHVDVSLLSLLLYTYPAFVTVAAILLGRDHVTPRRMAALAAASAGVALVLVGAGSGTADAVGVTMGVGAALTYTAYILVADTVIQDAPPIAFSAVIAAGAFFTFSVISLVSGRLNLDFEPAGWGWLACIAVVSTIVAVLAFFAGLRRVGPSNASIISTVEPPVTVLLAFVVFGERLGAVQLLGGVLVLSAVVVLQAGSSAELKRPERRPLEASPQPVPG
jgi:drug/metabolite transporter (DMT)-like permease